MSAYCANDILALASGIYEDINSPTSLSVPFISGWITSSASLGNLNNRLTTSFFYSGGCISGGFGDTEAAIYGMMYQKEYYRKQAQQVLAGGGLLWTSINEGDSRITRANPADISKSYMALSKDAEEELHIAVANWKNGHVLTVSVDAAPLAAWPNP